MSEKLNEEGINPNSMPLCFKFTIKKKKKLVTLKAQLSILCAA